MKKPIFSVSIVSLMLACFLHFVTIPSFAASIEDVDNLVADGDFEGALEFAEQALTKDADNPSLLLQKGYILINLNRLDEAEAFYLDLVSRIPDSPEPMNNLGAIYQLQGRLVPAIRQFSETIAKFPNFAAAYENLGDSYIRIALNNYEKGATLNPDHGVLHSKTVVAKRFQEIVQKHAITKQAANSNNAAKEAQSQDQPLTEEQIVNETIAFLTSWVNAWSAKDIERYLLHYSDQFQPSKEMPLDAWTKRKNAIFNAAQFINVEIKDITVTIAENGTVAANFNQRYESNTFESTSNKTLTLKREKEKNRLTIIAEE